MPKVAGANSEKSKMFSTNCFIKITAEVNATLEIKKFDGKRDLRSEIISFNFDDSSVVSPNMGSGRRKIDKLTLGLPGGDADYLVAHSLQNGEKVYPEMIIKGRFSSGTNGTQTRAVFTFYQVTVKEWVTDKTDLGERIFIFKIGFEKFSYVLDSTASVLK